MVFLHLYVKWIVLINYLSTLYHHQITLFTDYLTIESVYLLLLVKLFAFDNRKKRKTIVRQ